MGNVLYFTGVIGLAVMNIGVNGGVSNWLASGVMVLLAAGNFMGWSEVDALRRKLNGV